MKRRLVPAGLMLIAACGAPVPASGSIPVELDDFYIAPASSYIAAGEVAFHVFNEGEFPHTLVIARNSGEVVFASDVVAPGHMVDIALDLDPDLYHLTCRIVVQLEDGQLVDHYQEGMGELITVEAGG